MDNIWHYPVATHQSLKLGIRKLQLSYYFSYYYMINLLNKLALKQFCVDEKFMPNLILHLSVTLAYLQ